MQFIEIKDDQPVLNEDGNYKYIENVEEEDTVAIEVPENYVALKFSTYNCSTSKNGSISYKDFDIGEFIIKREYSSTRKSMYFTAIRANKEDKGIIMMFKKPQNVKIESGIFLTSGGFRVQFITKKELALVKVKGLGNAANFKNDKPFTENFKIAAENIIELPEYCYPIYDSVVINFIDGKIGTLKNQLKKFLSYVIYEYPEKKNDLNLVTYKSIKFINDMFLKSSLGFDEIDQYYEETLKCDAPTKSFELVSFQDIPEEQIEYLWYPYIPLGTITLLVGDPGIGKSYIALKLASIISKGEKFPFDFNNKSIELQPSNVIVQNGEDSKTTTIRYRLSKLEADISKIWFIKEKDLAFKLDNIDTLEKYLYEKHPKLIVIDPITQFLPQKISMDRANEVRTSLSPLAELAARYKCTFLLIAHKNKNTKTDGIYRVLGSIDFVGICRSMLTATKIDGKTYLKQEKNSTGEFGKTIEYEINEDGLTFIKQVDNTVNNYEILKPIEEAKQFILEQLKNGEVSSSDIRNLAYSEGISKNTLDRAKKELGVGSQKRVSEDGTVYWVWKINMETTSVINNEEEELYG